MKAAISLVLFIFVATGCTTLGAIQSDSGNTVAAFGSAGPDSVTPSDPFPPQDTNSMPRLIIPATGGPPVLGIPVGGNIFLPVTGGPPVPGIPITP
jgi:hypothetical protein